MSDESPTTDLEEHSDSAQSAGDEVVVAEPELQEENERLRQELEQLKIQINDTQQAPVPGQSVPTAEPDQAPLRGLPFKERSRRAVIIDDSKLIHIRFRSIIESYGISVVATSQDGCDGADLVTMHAPRLVVLDYNMPGANGAECTRMIREVDNQVKIFVISGFLDAARIAILKNAGVDDILVKPINEQKFAEALHRLGI